MDDYERAAGHLVASILGGVLVQRDIPGAAESTRDFDLVLADGEVVGLEVTRVTDPTARSMWSAIGRTEWKVEGLGQSWSLDLRRNAQIKRLRTNLARLLGALEAVDLEKFDGESRPSQPEVASAVAELRALGVGRGTAVGAVGEPPLVLVGTTDVGSTGPSAVAEIVQREAAKADNRAKLGAVGGGHLFVWVEHGASAHVAMHAHDWLPDEPPDLPPEVLVAWVGRVAGGEGPLRANVLWRADRQTGWSDMTSRLRA